MKTSFPRHQLGTDSRSPAWSECFIYSLELLLYVENFSSYACLSVRMCIFAFVGVRVFTALLFDGIVSVISHLQIAAFTRFCVSLWVVCGFVHCSPTRSAVAAGGSFMNGPHFAEILPEMISSWLETLRHARALHATPAAWLGSPASGPAFCARASPAHCRHQ